ncbi:MAG: YdeI/OmpD-associated family protein [Verrucomicrobiae bacterium]|nr:YdeI/OmpD-associated family protein [Verrucomicrobiae bacterium]
MKARDPRVDAYIAQAPEYARPILSRLRELVHTACPEVEEAIKWRCPTFQHQGLLCGMAAFKRHCGFSFWKEKLLLAADWPDHARMKEALERVGRITTLGDLPSDKILLACIQRAAELNEQGVRTPRPAKARSAKKPLDIPPGLAAALQRHPGARQAFENFSPSHRREYIEWIAEAKREETRARRIETTLAWLSEGKPRNWKYMSRGNEER